MTVTVDPATFIITVAKSELTLVQSVPTEIYNMDLNEFRLALKDWEDDATGGITFTKTHVHNTEVQLGGLTYARVVEIIEPYTTTFEDGQYAVNLVGANSNVGDRVNVNQVSVRSQNSAGLISTPLIEFASFEGGIWWDSDNVTGKASYGTIFPAGTRLQPARLLTDVRLIAEYRGLNVIYVMGSGLVDTGLDFDRYVFEGQTHVNNVATISDAASVQDAVFRDLTVTGILDGGNEITNSIIDDLEYVNGHIHNCGLVGQITLGGGSSAVIADCKTIDPFDPPIIDMGGSGQDLIMPNYSGLLTIQNLSGSNFVGVGLNHGLIVLDSTSITSGTFHCSGVGVLNDEFGNYIPSGTWNDGVTIINTLLADDTISDAVWEDTDIHTTVGSKGEVLDTIRKLTGNKITRINDIITIYNADNTIYKQYDLSDGGRVEII